VLPAIVELHRNLEQLDRRAAALEGLTSALDARLTETAGQLDQAVARGTAASLARTDVLGQAVNAATQRSDAKLGEIGQLLAPVLNSLDGLRIGQERLIAGVATVANGVGAADVRGQQYGEALAGEVLGRLDRLAELSGSEFQVIGDLRRGLDDLVARITAPDGLPPVLEARLADADERLHSWTESLDKVWSRLDHVTDLAQRSPFAVVDDEGRVVADAYATALRSITDALNDLGHHQDQLGSYVAARLDHLGAVIDGTFRHLEQMAANAAPAVADWIAAFESGLTAAVHRIEATVVQRSEDQLAHVVQRQDEVTRGFLDELAYFGTQVEAGLQRTTADLQRSVLMLDDNGAGGDTGLHVDGLRAGQLEVVEQQKKLTEAVEQLGAELMALRRRIPVRPRAEQLVNDEDTVARLADALASRLAQNGAVAPGTPTASAGAPPQRPARRVAAAKTKTPLVAKTKSVPARKASPRRREARGAAGGH
jgi:hypothetical protein